MTTLKEKNETQEKALAALVAFLDAQAAFEAARVTLRSFDLYDDSGFLKDEEEDAWRVYEPTLDALTREFGEANIHPDLLRQINPHR